MFIAWKYYIKSEMMAEYQKWLLSDEAKELNKKLEKETGWKYIDTYFPILGFGEDTVFDWIEIPDWATLDKLRTSKVWQELFEKTCDFMDNTRFTSNVIYRKVSDARIVSPSNKK